MTGLIKSKAAQAAAKVRALPGVGPGVGGGQAASPDPAQAEIARLRGDLETLARAVQERDGEIAGLKREVEKARIEGEAAGRKAGLTEAEDRHAEMLERLDAGVAQAIEIYAGEFAALERLAVAVARESLEKLMADPAERVGIVTQMIRRQAAQLDGQALVRVEVSRRDFADEAQLAALKDTVGHPAVEIRARAELASGDCRMVLGLGALEVGIGQQWGRLSQVLEDLAEPGAEP